MLEVYIKDGCPYCEKQVNRLKEEGISYRLYNISRDRDALKKARDEYRADKVPVVVEDGVLKSIGYQGMG